MAMTPTAVVSALASSDKTAIIHVRGGKQDFDEILNDVRNFQNGFQQLGGHSNPDGATRLVVVIDRLDSTPSNSPAGEQLFNGGSVATLARRV
jgi:hypothetical protein